MKTPADLKCSDYALFTPQELRKLSGFGRLQAYKKGAYIFRDKYAEDGIYILAEGKASIYKMSDSGQKRAIFILDDGAILNEPMSVDIKSSSNCTAFEDCKVIIIDKNTFYDLLAKDFELAKAVIDQLSHKARRMYRQLKNTADTTKAEKKVAAKLWKLCRDYGTETEDGVFIGIDITSAGLADLMGVRRETVSRAFRVLQEMNLITHEKRRLIVHNPDSLSKFFKGM